MVEHKNEIKSIDVLSHISEIKSSEDMTNFQFYYRISKIDYENFNLMNNDREIDMSKKDTLKKINLREDHVLKYNQFLFFRKLSEDNYSKLLVEVIKDTTVRDYLEYYVIIN